MDRKFTLFACLLICCVSEAFNKDISNELLSKLPKYSIIQPQIIHRRPRSINKNKLEEADNLISYLIEINHKKHRLHLERNEDFLSPDLVSEVKLRKVPVHCYYHGEVEGYTDSIVAVSTCNGLRGVIMFEDKTFGLEPLPGWPSNKHVLYDLKDVHSGASTCGVSDNEESEVSSQNKTNFEVEHTLTSLVRKKRNLATTSYVELALIVDHLRYIYKQQNETAVREEMVEVANLVDGYYKRLNIRVMLVHLEVFTESNPVNVEDEPGKVLGNFAKWRKETLLPRSRNDMAQFVIGRPGAYGNVLGMAYVGTVCSESTSGGINVFTDGMTVPYFSTIVAHEMGHNLGMAHDDTRCSCDCIMGGGGGAEFSTCSGQDFEKLVLRGEGECLKNVPSHSDVVGIAECGNGLLEDGEQCDCGTPEECNNKCCNAATCTFTQGSACAAGRCCQDCQLRVAGHPCRRSENSCDLPEFCNGTNAFCPDDFYIMDGLECQNKAAYCYEGRCQTYQFQCQQLFSDHLGATKADDVCFQAANAQGNQYGNCGQTSSGEFIKCNSANAMCGKVQCTNVDANHPPPGGSISIQIVNGSKCVNADFNMGTDVLDPAYSNPGSPCASGKTCVDFECVDAAVLRPNFICDAKTTCNDRGVCNDRGHCHCDVGWAPPNCASSGWGGSIDSGPASIDYSLRNGLLIFFLLVVPLLVLAVLLFLYMFRRDTLDPCLKRGHKSRSTTNRTSAPPQMNVPAPVHTATQPPLPPVETKPVYPPAMGEYPPEKGHYPPEMGVPGWKYGELDYWKEHDQVTAKPQSDVPMRPPSPPRQGPGVPRPIPPRPPPKMDYET